MDSSSFAPIVPNNSKVLILGTMPGIKSINDQQYYAHPQNVFWPILFQLFGKSLSKNYTERIKLLEDKGIALWDTLKFCYREGSLDSNIRNAKPNEIPTLLNQNQSIKSIIFNGKSAQNYYKKFHKEISGITYYCLPSTSPANARMKPDDKLNAWYVVKELL